MNMRRRRSLLSGLVILGFVVAQFISLAHACMVGAHADRAVSAEVAATMPADCPAMAADAPSSDAACQANCVPQAQADQGVDVRIAALAPPSILVVKVAAVLPEATQASAPPPRARIASPPLALLYGRLLI
jgi:hypothetical protein